MGIGSSSTTTKIIRHFAIDNPTQLLEYTNRLYRVATKDHLTIQVYTLCKNIIEKILFPARTNVSLVDFHNEIISKDYRNRRLRLNINNNLYDIPLDFYIRSVVTFIEENNMIDNLELFMLNKIFNVSENVSKQCLNNMRITVNIKLASYINEEIDSYNVKYNGVDVPDINDTINFQLFAKEFILHNMKCQYNVIKLNIIEFGKAIGHATVLFVEKTDNEMKFFLYDPHGYAAASYTATYNINYFLEEFVDKLNQANTNLGLFNGSIKYKETNVTCIRAIQRYTNDYDIGMCMLFRLVWLYFVINITIELKKISAQMNVITPKVEEWVYMIDEFFTTQLKPIEAYYVVILFSEYLISQYMIIDRRFIESMLMSDVFVNYLVTQKGALDISKYMLSQEQLMSERFGRNLSRKEIQSILKAEKEIQTERKRKEQQDKQQIYKEVFQELEDLEEKLDSLKEKERRELEQYILNREEQLGEEYKRRVEKYDEERIAKEKEKEEKEEEDDDIYMEQDVYEKELEEQREKEKYYKKGFFETGKKRVLEECNVNNDCISGCCDFNKLEKKYFCQPKNVCGKR
jgi:hypothetical protein